MPRVERSAFGEFVRLRRPIARMNAQRCMNSCARKPRLQAAQHIQQSMIDRKDAVSLQIAQCTSRRSDTHRGCSRHRPTSTWPPIFRRRARSRSVRRSLSSARRRSSGVSGAAFAPGTGQAKNTPGSEQQPSAGLLENSSDVMSDSTSCATLPPTLLALDAAQIRSNTAAMPCPPPMHIVTSA